MGIHIFRTEDELGEFVAGRIVSAIEDNPAAVIGLATGSSPLTSYAEWARLAGERGLSQDRVRGFALDEYVGLDPAHPESYQSVIRRTVTEPVGLNPELVSVPAGTGELALAAAEYEAAISAVGGIDVQLLGLGRNGHLGFNEPGSAFDSRTRVVDLAQSTIEDNARFFGGVASVPTQAVTQGLGTILEARVLIVIAMGEGKAEAVAESIEAEPSVDMPGSAAQAHPNVLWCLDEAAASRLSAARLHAA